MTLPIVGITMGDPAGVGPEVVMKALARADAYALCRPLVIGDAKQLARAEELLNLKLMCVQYENPEQANFKPGTVEVIEVGQVPENIPYGKVSAVAGEAAYRYIERAVQLALERSIDAICTAPINKEALNAAGHKFPGHTELLAKLTGTKEVSLTLLAPKLRVIHVTAHIGLLDAIEKIDAALVERTIARGRELLRARRNPPIRASASAASTRTQAKVACSAAARRRARSFPRSKPLARAAGRWTGRCRPTAFSILPRAATTTWWSRCTTTRGTARSRRWAWSTAST